MTKLRTLVTLSALLLGAVAISPASAADVAAGKAKAGLCAGCHGVAGQSAQAMWPNLAGQSATYLASQIRAFMSKARINAQMAPMVASLSEEDVDNISAWFASLPAATGVATGDVALGESLYRGGDKKRAIPACMSCHGPGGKGMPAAGFPSVAGQHATYSSAQLKAFQAGTRTTDPAEMMRAIAAKLNEAEIESVSQYMAGLR
jgi:cytochrome c553